MIEKLIEEQHVRIAEYRNRYFRQATSIEPSDRSRAEAAARRMAEIAGVKVVDVYWVNSPMDGSSLWASLCDSICTTLRASIWANLCDSIRDSLIGCLRDSLIASLRASIWTSLCASLRASSLWASLYDSLRTNLRDSLYDSLCTSLCTSLWDTTGWIAYYTYIVEILEIECDEETLEKLRLHNEIAANCFALWIMPGSIILCERPESVEITDGQLVDLKWRSK